MTDGATAGAERTIEFLARFNREEHEAFERGLRGFGALVVIVLLTTFLAGPAVAWYLRGWSWWILGGVVAGGVGVWIVAAIWDGIMAVRMRGRMQRAAVAAGLEFDREAIRDALRTSPGRIALGPKEAGMLHRMMVAVGIPEKEAAEIGRPFSKLEAMTAAPAAMGAAGGRRGAGGMSADEILEASGLQLDAVQGALDAAQTGDKQRVADLMTAADDVSKALEAEMARPKERPEALLADAKAAAAAARADDIAGARERLDGVGDRIRTEMRAKEEYEAKLAAAREKIGPATGAPGEPRAATAAAGSGARLRFVLIVRDGPKPSDTKWYVEQVISGLGLPVGPGTKISFETGPDLSDTYLLTRAMLGGMSSEALKTAILQPFSDKEGRQGRVLKVS